MLSPSSTRRPKAADVAAEAGVSAATVSLVINGRATGRVSLATQERVQRAITKLGYAVHSAAQSLATGKRHCVALVVPDVANPFFSQVAAGVATALAGDYRLLLAVSDPVRDRADLDQLAAFGLDGILVDFPYAQVCGSQLSCPVVMLDEPTGPANMSRVYFETGPATRALVDRMIGLGHRRFVYLDATRHSKALSDRRRQVRNRLQATPDTSVIHVRADIVIGAARSLVVKSWPDWLRAGVTAIIAATDVLAYGTLIAFAELAVTVPQDISIGSFDDLMFSEITSPPLTTVRLSAFDLGYESAGALLKLMADPNGPPQRKALTATLTDRSSLGPARKCRVDVPAQPSPTRGERTG